jgi:glutamate-1-semialdehyde 2,1-aminomutase
MSATIDRGRLAARMADEVAQFEAVHPRSKALFERAGRSLLGGVPMSWMAKWAGPYPLFVEEATGAHFRCVDGHDHVDFCLGDTGAMTGHSPEEAVAGIAA